MPHILLAMATFVPSFLRGTEEAYPRTPMGSIVPVAAEVWML